MLKKRIIQKLKSEKGTSIFFGLLLFLVASVVSVVILNGAVTTIKRVESDRKAEQNYLICSSAARLLRDAIENSSIKWQKKVVMDGTKPTGQPDISWSGNSKTGSDTEGKFATFLTKYISDYSKNADLSSDDYKKTFIISVPSNLADKKEELGEVTAVMKIGKSDGTSETANAGFDISVLLTVGSGSDICEMTLSLSGKAGTTQIELTDDQKTQITSITYTWDAANIIYGEGSAA